MIIVEIETTTIRTDHETILSHHIEIILNFKTHKVKIVPAEHQNIKDKLIKYTLQMKQIQTLQVLTKHNLQNYSLMMFTVKPQFTKVVRTAHFF